MVSARRFWFLAAGFLAITLVVTVLPDPLGLELMLLFALATIAALGLGMEASRREDLLRGNPP